MAAATITGPEIDKTAPNAGAAISCAQTLATRAVASRWAVTLYIRDKDTGTVVARVEADPDRRTVLTYANGSLR